MRPLITSGGSSGKPKNPKVACQECKILRTKSKKIVAKKNCIQLQSLTFRTWFLVSIVNFGSTETKVVQALKARHCIEESGSGKTERKRWQRRISNEMPPDVSNSWGYKYQY